MITADEILAALSAEFTLTPDDPARRGTAPAETFLVDGGPGRVGVIASVTRPFCGVCDRVRLTADGQIRNCLFATQRATCAPCCAPGPATRSWPTLAPRRRGKLPGAGIGDPGFLQPARPMSAIGG